MPLIKSLDVPNATLALPFRLNNGGSRPRVIDFDDGVRRIVKWHPSIHGRTATYSELVASKLGLLVGAPLNRGTIVYVDRDVLPRDDQRFAPQPYHVGFTYMPGSNFEDSDFVDVKNGNSLPAAAAHLAWLLIGDQEGHNQYLARLEQVTPDGSRSTTVLYHLIDQSSIYGTDDWSSSLMSEADRAYRLPIHMRRRLTIDKVAPFIEKIEGLDESEIRDCLKHYPDEWEMDPEAIERLGDMLISRRSHLRGVLEKEFGIRSRQ